jgi:hypothetical protein
VSSVFLLAGIAIYREGAKKEKRGHKKKRLILYHYI